MKHCPNTLWSETRNTLAELVPKKYDYYAFLDHDMGLDPQTDLGPYEQMLEDLELNPAVLTYYPGNNIHTPYATDKEYFKSRKYSCIPFTHNGIKIVHHSLMDWFFPLCVNFSVDIDACHMFNIQEIPFLKYVVCSHNMIHHNNPTDSSGNQIYNSDGAFSKHKMDEMWKWIRSSFKMNKIIEFYTPEVDDRSYIDYQHKRCFGGRATQDDSLTIKKVFVDLMKDRNINPSPMAKDINYFNKDKISKVFDLSHEFFINKEYNLEKQFMKIDDGFRKKVEYILRRDVTFDTLKTQYDPWPNIIKTINEELVDYRNITSNECVDIYQNMENNESLFIHSAKTNPDLQEYLRDKTVALVGPAPYLSGQAKGKLIDSYDVVVRIQPEIWDINDFGSRTDIIQSCLNSAYSPKVASFLERTPVGERPKFIICNDTVVREADYPGSKKWLDSVKEYNDYLKQYGVPFAHLKNDDNTWERWALYWEVYAKPHVEKIEDNLYTYYSGNFNSGYGAINMLLACPLKELAIFGLNFYNFGIVRNMSDKYNPAYIKAQGPDGTYLGPDKLLHDQMSQMMHCRNVLIKDPRIKMDDKIVETLCSDDLAKRIDKFKKLPKILHFTQ